MPYLDQTLLIECDLNKNGRNPHTLANVKCSYISRFNLCQEYGWTDEKTAEFYRLERRLRKFLNTGIKE